MRPVAPFLLTHGVTIAQNTWRAWNGIRQAFVMCFCIAGEGRGNRNGSSRNKKGWRFMRTRPKLFSTQPPRSFLVGWPVVTSSVGQKVGITHLNAGTQVSSFPKYCRRELSLFLNYLWLSSSCIGKGWVGGGGGLRWISRFGNHAKFWSNYKRWVEFKFLEGAHLPKFRTELEYSKLHIAGGRGRSEELLLVQKDDQDWSVWEKGEGSSCELLCLQLHEQGPAASRGNSELFPRAPS